MDLYLASTSPSKISQFKDFLLPRGHQLKPVLLPLIEIQSMDVHTVCRYKLQMACESTHYRPLIVDDTGVRLEGMDGFPGALIKSLLEVGKLDLIRKVSLGFQKDNKIRAHVGSKVMIHFGDRVSEGYSEMSGVLDFSDFGRYQDIDCTGVFIPDGYDRPQNLLQISSAEAYSHRWRALEQALSGFS